MTYILSNRGIKCKCVEIQMQMSAPESGAWLSNIVPPLLSEHIGRYNIGSIRCDEKIYSPEAEKAPTQFVHRRLFISCTCTGAIPANILEPGRMSNQQLLYCNLRAMP